MKVQQYLGRVLLFGWGSAFWIASVVADDASASRSKPQAIAGRKICLRE